MTEVFGFDELTRKLEKMSDKGRTTDRIVKETAEDIKNDAIKLAEGFGLRVTGAGVAGILAKPLGFSADIGWGGRPNLHLYFHEKGFHAGFSKGKRSGRGKRKRRYKKGSRVYMPPKPHVKPAALKNREKFVQKILKHIMEG